MKRTPSVALRHLLVIAGLALAGSTSGLFAASADTYYVNDHLATTTAVADAAGEIAALEADAFGTPMGDAGQAARYTGKPYDADMGAYVFPFRNYRSEEARWMSADPSGFPDGVNARVYAPLALCEVDPLGLATFTITMSFTSPVEGSTYTYELSNPPPLNLNLAHSITISVTGTRAANEQTLFSLKRALFVDGSRRTNEELNLEFGTQTTRTWDMSISNLNVFFAANTSSNGEHTSVIYAQVFHGQTAVTSRQSQSVSYNINVTRRE